MVKRFPTYLPISLSLHSSSKSTSLSLDVERERTVRCPLPRPPSLLLLSLTPARSIFPFLPLSLFRTFSARLRWARKVASPPIFISIFVSLVTPCVLHLPLSLPPRRFTTFSIPCSLSLSPSLPLCNPTRSISNQWSAVRAGRGGPEGPCASFRRAALPEQIYFRCFFYLSFISRFSSLAFLAFFALPATWSGCTKLAREVRPSINRPRGAGQQNSREFWKGTLSTRRPNHARVLVERGYSPARTLIEKSFLYHNQLYQPSILLPSR